jgi:hypothetical protein
MNHTRRFLLALSVHLNTRGFAFVLFESPLAPFDWGTPEIRGDRKHERCLKKITSIIDQYEPEGLVLQDMSEVGTRRTQRIVNLNAAIITLAKSREMPVFVYSREIVRETFFQQHGVMTKQDIAEIIAKSIPAFERYLPSPRKPWQSEDSRMGLFDAAGMGLVFYQRTNGAPE